MATLSDALQEAIVVAGDNQVVNFAVELIHPSFIDEDSNPDPIRVCDDNVDRTFKHESTAPLDPGGSVVYKACPFDIIPPGYEETGVTSGKLTIENISGTIARALKLIQNSVDPITVIIRQYSEDDTTGPGDYWVGLALRKVSIGKTSAEGDLRYDAV
jgi:hypothetical protein